MINALLKALKDEDGLQASRDLFSFREEVRPSKDFEGFLNRLQGGLDFTRRQTSTWSIEDWELAVDAGASDDWPIGGLNCHAIELLEDCSSDELFSGHGFWILFALAHLRGHAAFYASLSRDTRPFRTEQLQDINIPECMSVLINAQFKLGYDSARRGRNGKAYMPEWVKRALSAPLGRSRAERSSSIQ